MAFEVTPDGPPPSAARKVRRNETLHAFAPGDKPHDLTTERAVLAGIFMSNEAFLEIQNSLKAEHFFLPAHQEIYKALVQLTFKNIPADLTTLAGYLRESGQLDSVGGAAYLSQIAGTPSTSMHAIEYARIVADLAWRRRILEASEFCRSAALKAGDTREIAAEIERTIFQSTQEKKSTQMSKIGDLLPDAIKEFERRADNKGLPSTAVLTGLHDLDDCLSGLRPGQLLVLAARPGMGKTSLAVNIMCHASMKTKKNVLFFSLEMTQQEVVERVLSGTAGIDANKIRNGNLSPKDFNELFYAADEVGSAPFFIDDRSVLSPYDVLAQARKLNSALHLTTEGAQVDLIVVDYIQIMKSGSSFENRSLEVAAITGGLKAIAKDLKVPVIALSQLNREGAKRPGESKKPQLSDLRDSGAIEADADVVLFIHREQGPETDSRAAAEAEIIVAKQRSGPTKSVKVTWLGHLTQFANFVPQAALPPDSYGGGDPGPGAGGEPPISYDF